jgi:hypothetical protein
MKTFFLNRAPLDCARSPVKLAILTQSAVMQNVWHRNILKDGRFAQLKGASEGSPGKAKRRPG